MSKGEAEKSTATRDAAYQALRDYLKELRGVSRGALEDHPGALTKLKL